MSFAVLCRLFLLTRAACLYGILLVLRDQQAHRISSPQGYECGRHCKHTVLAPADIQQDQVQGTAEAALVLPNVSEAVSR